MLGLLCASCSRSQPAPEKGTSGTRPAKEMPSAAGALDAPKVVAFGTLLRDAAGVYDGKVIETTAMVQSYLERPGADVIRLEEPGAPPDGPNMFCVLAERIAARPALQDRIVIRGTKRGNGVSPCSIVSDAGR